MDLLLRIAPFFGLIALGAALGRWGVLSARVGGWLASYTYWLGFPVLLVHWIWSPSADPAGVAAPFGVYAAAMLLVLAAAAGAAQLRNWPTEARAGGPMASAVGNTTYLGGPLALIALGPAARPFAAAMMAVDCILLTGVAVAMLQSAKGGAGSWRRTASALTNPTLLGAGAGLALWLARAPRPAALDLPISAVAAFTGPLALLALGGVIGRNRSAPRREEQKRLGLILGVKLLAAPAVVWVAFTAAGVDPLARSVGVIMAACPTALNVFVQTRAAGVYEREAALAVVFGTAASAVTLTVLLALLGAGGGHTRACAGEPRSRCVEPALDVGQLGRHADLHPVRRPIAVRPPGPARAVRDLL